MKVFVAAPTGELTRYPEFWHSLAGQQGLNGIEVVTKPCRGVYIPNNQNALVREFLQTDADYFWLVNDDQVYPPHALARLLSHDVSVVVPVCLGHDIPFRPLLYDTDRGDTEGAHVRYLNDSDSGLVRIVSSGGGGMLIKRKVLEAIQDPWFEVHMAQIEGQPAMQSSEDIDFCRKLQALDIPMWCDTDCLVGHITVFIVWPYRDRDTRGWSTVISRGADHIQLQKAMEPEPAPLIVQPSRKETFQLVK